ncbi:hypothetical protein [Escherichia coli]|uniref:hypothetical protein n=1 Tax=Escherichia coli TaxID=562 RepID=UPI00157A3F02|nr:hypothetical protein [Escherichia coli]
MAASKGPGFADKDFRLSGGESTAEVCCVKPFTAEAIFVLKSSALNRELIRSFDYLMNGIQDRFPEKMALFVPSDVFSSSKRAELWILFPTVSGPAVDCDSLWLLFPCANSDDWHGNLLCAGVVARNRFGHWNLLSSALSSSPLSVTLATG